MRLKKLKSKYLAGVSSVAVVALLMATATGNREAIKQAQDNGKVVQILVSASATSTMTMSMSTTTGARFTWPAVYHKPAVVQGDPDPERS
jgi:hypothetical protein